MIQNKLDHDQRMFVLRMYGEGHRGTFIAKEVKDQFSITITPKACDDTCKAKKNEPFVKAFRDSYLSKVKSVPIANKRYRLDDLERERQTIKRLIDKNDKKSKSDITQYLALTGRLIQISEIAREEMEKKPHLFQNVVMTGEVTDEYLHKRRKELESKLGKTFRRGTAGAGPDTPGAEQEDK